MRSAPKKLVMLVLGAAALCLPGTALAQPEYFQADPATLGLIPDAPPSQCGTYGPTREVTFTVSGLEDTVVDMMVIVRFSPVHVWMGDIDAVLVGPSGASHTLFSRTGATTATGCGDSSDLLGPYFFWDSAPVIASARWWQVASSLGSDGVMPSALYRTTAPGGAGATTPAPVTAMTPVFSGANPNGVWTLRFRDAGGGDTTSVAAATLMVDAVDRIPPETTITKKPKRKTTKRIATFAFVSSEAGSTFRCKLDKQPWRACSSPKTYRKLRVGLHTFRVRATDEAGNVDPTPAKHTWRVTG